MKGDCEKHVGDSFSGYAMTILTRGCFSKSFIEITYHSGMETTSACRTRTTKPFFDSELHPPQAQFTDYSVVLASENKMEPNTILPLAASAPGSRI